MDVRTSTLGKTDQVETFSDDGQVLLSKPASLDECLMQHISHTAALKFTLVFEETTMTLLGLLHSCVSVN